jgi:hypothetical protein
MKRIIPLLGMAALALAGCATHEHRQARYHDRYYVVEEHPVDRVVVREYESYPYRYRHSMEPQFRGKHAESLGWTRDHYYYERGY